MKKQVKQAAIFELYVEGKFHSNYYSEKKANKVRAMFESEGWNIKLVKFESTVIGRLGIEV